MPDLGGQNRTQSSAFVWVCSKRRRASLGHVSLALEHMHRPTKAVRCSVDDHTDAIRGPREAAIAHPNFALEDHWDFGDAVRALEDEDWDFVVMQQGSFGARSKPGTSRVLGRCLRRPHRRKRGAAEDARIAARR